jgi:hypothetical protein
MAHYIEKRAICTSKGKGKGKGKGKVHPRTDHEGPEGEQIYICTLPSTSTLDGGGWSTPRPGHFTPGKDPEPIVGPRGRSGRVRKISPPHQDSIPGPSM